MKTTPFMILVLCLGALMIACNKDNPTSPVETPESTGNIWETRASMPTSRAYFCSAEVDGQIYLIGGLIDLSHNSDAVEVYDPETDTWTTKNNMPAAILGLAAAVVDGKIYTLGGRTGNVYSGTTLAHTYVYDPVADTWTRKANMPTPRAFLTTSVIDGKIFAIGGSATGFVGAENVEMYDPATDTWTIKASLPLRRSMPTADVYGGKIYVIGGGDADGNDAGVAYPAFDVYDPGSNSWVSKPKIAQARIGHGSAVIDKRLYICGGFSSSTILQDLCEYNFDNDKWTVRASMPVSRRCFSVRVHNGKLFVFGGITALSGGGSSILKSVAAYTPPAASN